MSSDPLALTLSRSGPPATLEAHALFRLSLAGIREPPGLPSASAEVVVMPGINGGVVVWAPSEKLAILSAARERKNAQKKEITVVPDLPPAA